MALVKCDGCGKEISDSAKKCPHCGSSVSKEGRKVSSCPECGEIIEDFSRECPKCGVNLEESTSISEKKKNLPNSVIILKMMIVVIVVALTIGIMGIIFINNDKFEEEEIVQSNDRNTSVVQIMVNTEYINIRESKSVDSEIIGKVYRGEIYTVLSEDANSSYRWIEIKTNNNIHGYISGMADYVTKLDIANGNESEKEVEEVNKPNKTNNNNTNNNNTNNTNNTNKTENKEKENDETKVCNKTCENGYVLKNSDSAQCYCEEVMTTEIAKNRLIKVLQSVKYTCDLNKCILYEEKLNDDNTTYTYSYYFDFNSEVFSVIFLYEEYNGGMEVNYKYGQNTATSKYIDATGVYNTTCSQIYPFMQCDSDTNKARKFLNDAIKLFKAYLKNANISVHDLSREF